MRVNFAGLVIAFEAESDVTRARELLVIDVTNVSRSPLDGLVSMPRRRGHAHGPKVDQKRSRLVSISVLVMNACW